MLCQLCQKRIASVHFTQIINNNKVEMYLCEKCANEKGNANFISPLSLGDFLSGFFSTDIGGSYVAAPDVQIRCEVCGMSFSDFQSTGKIGCSNCYKIFGDKLKPIIKRLHGNVEHIGKAPSGFSSSMMKTTKEIEKLKEELNKAIQAEEYEKAALLRDKIKELESRSSGN